MKISPLLKKVVYPSLSKSGAFRLMAGRGLAVVTYHGVLPRDYQVVDPALDGNLVTTDALRNQLRLLRAHYEVVSPADVLAWIEGRGKIPPRAVLITCDDGLLNNLTDMLPVLLEEGIQSLFFVTAASAGDQRKRLWYEELLLVLLGTQRNREGGSAEFYFSHGDIEIRVPLAPRDQMQAAWWSAVKRLSQIDARSREEFLSAAREHMVCKPTFDAVALRRFGLMTSNELRQLADSGMTLGAHTVSHPVLSQVPKEQAQMEILESRNRLEATLGQRVWAFAYPFGDAQSVTPHVLGMPREAGFATAFLNYGGGLGAELPRFAMPRVHVTSNMHWGELEAHISGWYASLRRFVA